MEMAQCIYSLKLKPGATQKVSSAGLQPPQDSSVASSSAPTEATDLQPPPSPSITSTQEESLQLPASSSARSSRAFSKISSRAASSQISKASNSHF